jgi:histidine ammonia-lyase
MLLEYVGGSALGEVRATAGPAGLQSVVLSLGLEEDASFASLAAHQAISVVGPVSALLACELVGAVRAVRAKKSPPANELLARALASCTDLVDDLADRDLTGDIELAGRLLPRLAALLPT